MAQDFASYAVDTGTAGALSVRSDPLPSWPAPPVQGSIHRMDWPGGRGGPPSGVDVSPNSALAISAYFACIARVSRDIACLPFSVVRCRPGKGKQRVPRHPVNRIRWVEMPWPLSGSLPDGMPIAAGSNRVKVVASAQAHALSMGNGLFRIRREEGIPSALELLDPSQWQPLRRYADAGLYYKGPAGVNLAPDDVLHIAGLGYDGLQGYSIARVARDSLALAKAQEIFKGRFYGSGGQPKAVLETAGKLGPDAARNLATSWQEVYGGPENSHRVVVLEQGLTLKPFAISYDDQKFLQSQQWQLTEICRWFGVPPNKIGDYSQAQLASAGIEAMNLDYLSSAILQWVVGWECEMGEKLLTEDERAAGLTVEMDLSVLLRADTRTRGEYNQRALVTGWETINEVREREGRGPVEFGDQPFVPVNSQPIGKAAAWREDRAAKLAAAAAPPKPPAAMLEPKPGGDAAIGEAGDEAGDSPA